MTCRGDCDIVDTEGKKYDPDGHADVRVEIAAGTRLSALISNSSEELDRIELWRVTL